jgi:hypothetical protein
MSAFRSFGRFGWPALAGFWVAGGEGFEGRRCTWIGHGRRLLRRHRRRLKGNISTLY